MSNSTPLVLGADQSDALRELLNIAMGQAGDSLARVLDAYVELTIPDVSVVQADDMAEVMPQSMPGDGHVTAIRQAFFSGLRGEAIVLFSTQDIRQIRDLMGYELDEDAHDQELMSDVANILVGACLTGFARQIGVEISFAAPRVAASGGAVGDLFKQDDLAWDHSLLVKLVFGLKGRSFSCQLMIFMPEASILQVREVLDAYLDEL